MGARRDARELALQAIFALDSNAVSLPATLELVQSEQEIAGSARSFCLELVQGVADNLPRIDQLIDEKSTNWSLNRIGKIELGILRLAVFELIFRPDIPPTVTINEAIEIAKKFGTADSPSFVNGILDEIAALSVKNENSENIPTEEN